MGMNYYAAKRMCPHCDNRKILFHIGKSSYGWSFHFQATETIRSYQDLLLALQEPGVFIENEEGIETPIEQFKDLVDSKRDGKNISRIMSGAPYTPAERDYLSHDRFRSYDSRYEDFWLDEEGHAFSKGEFS